MAMRPRVRMMLLLGRARFRRPGFFEPRVCLRIPNEAKEAPSDPPERRRWCEMA